MITHTTFIRVRYGETDKMGYVYYGNYALYYELGRTELFRALGLTYKEIEASGVMLPVLNVQSKFIAAAKYDDELKIVTQIREIPSGFRVKFDYKIFNQNNVLIHKAMTELVFIDIDKNKPCRAPEFIKQILITHDNLE